ncbi:MAG: DegV family EDD domain-containing protein [Lachnospiraceae bacterium]|nr:DegV family EDD domain-containing protein [Lachnospiraceae bacterium]
MKPFKKIKALILDQARGFRERVFVLLTLIAVAMAAVALTGDILFGENEIEIITLAGAVVFVPLLTIIGVKTGKTELISGLISLGIIFVIMPVIFIFGGGVEGGAIPWLVFAFLYLGLVMTGWWKIASLILMTSVVCVLFSLDFYFPDLIYHHSRQMLFIDMSLGVIEVGFVCFFMTWFQTMMLVQENEKSRKETEKVEEMNRSQNRFFSNMSHEIRTPINAILGLNELILRQQDASEEIIKDANNIQGAGRMLLSLVNDILDFSRIEAGKMDIVPVNYNLGVMVSEITEMLWLRAENKGLEFRVFVDPSIPAELYGDEVRIRQILVNLLNNAVKYTESGSVTLSIDKEETRDDLVMLTYSVADTGTGIKQDAIPYLFDAFSRADEDKNAAIEGTGLGLSIVKQLVDLMNGSISVNSVYTQGSTFTVTLWQKVAREGAVGDINIGGGSGSKENRGYRPGFTAPDVRLLIVDDNEINREVEKKLLEGTCISVDTASGGEDALTMTLSTRYDLILMDHLMPQMDGVECLQRIRTQKGGMCNHAPVVVLTANAGSENQELYRNSGFDGYLLKPVSGRQLEESVLSHLPEGKVSRNSAEGAASYSISTASGYSRKIPLIIATNSCSEIPADILREQQIDIIPYNIAANGKVYYDRLEADTDELLRYRAAGVDLRAEAPTVEELELFFGNELKKAHNLLYITHSALISSEYEKAVTAAKVYGNVRVYDSGSASAGVGVLALYARKLSAAGRDTDRIIAELDKLKEKLRCIFAADNMVFAMKESRGVRAAGNILSVLGIRPFVRIRDGAFEISRLAMGEQDSCLGTFLDHAFGGVAEPDYDLLIVLHTGLSDEALKTAEKRIRENRPFKNVIFIKPSPVTALTVGSGSLGLVFFAGVKESPALSSMFETSLYDDYTEEEPAEEENTAEEESSGKEYAEEEPEAETETANLWYERIEGINGEKGIKNSGTEDFYRTVLGIFCESVSEKKAELEGFFDNSDWENYTIKIHALKSSARLIGGDALADDAQALENAGKAGDTDYIKANHERAMTDFCVLDRRIREALGIPEEKEEAAPEPVQSEPEVNEHFDSYLIECVYDALREAVANRDDTVIEETFSEVEGYPMPDEHLERMEKLKKCFAEGDHWGMMDLLDEEKKSEE